MDAEGFTQSQIRMLKHAVADTRDAAAKRHTYVAGVHQQPAWDDLCARGLAELVPPRRSQGLTVYRLTAAGVAAGRKLAGLPSLGPIARAAPRYFGPHTFKSA